MESKTSLDAKLYLRVAEYVCSLLLLLEDAVLGGWHRVLDLLCCCGLLFAIGWRASFSAAYSFAFVVVWLGWWLDRRGLSLRPTGAIICSCIPQSCVV
jgi:hypothetical protein